MGNVSITSYQVRGQQFSSCIHMTPCLQALCFSNMWHCSVGVEERGKVPKRAYFSAWNIESLMLSTVVEDISKDDTNIVCRDTSCLLSIEVFMLVNHSMRFQVGFMTS